MLASTIAAKKSSEFPNLLTQIINTNDIVVEWAKVKFIVVHSHACQEANITTMGILKKLNVLVGYRVNDSDSPVWDYFR